MERLRTIVWRIAAKCAALCRERPVTATLGIGAWVAFCGYWALGDPAEAVYAFSGTWLPRAARDALLDGVSWLRDHTDTMPLMLLGCFVLSLPLVLARKRRLIPILAATAVVCLPVLLWCLCGFDSGFALAEWFPWRWTNSASAQFHAVPVSMVLLGCCALPAADELLHYPRHSVATRSSDAGGSWRLFAILPLVAVNAACVVAGVGASAWLKALGLPPFHSGFLHLFMPFWTPPTALTRLLADPIVGPIALGCGVVLSLLPLVVVARTGRLRLGVSAFWVAFASSGYFGLWVVGDAVLNALPFA